MLYYDTPEEQGFDKKKAKVLFRYLCATTLRHYREIRFTQSTPRMAELSSRMDQLGEKNLSLKSSVTDLSNRLRQFQDVNSEASDIIQRGEAPSLQVNAATREPARSGEYGLKQIIELEKKLEQMNAARDRPPEAQKDRTTVQVQRIIKRERVPLDKDLIDALEHKIEEKLGEKHVHIIDDEAPDEKEVRPSRRKALDVKVEEKLGLDLTPLKNKVADIKRQIYNAKRSKKFSKSDVAELEVRQKQLEKKIFLLEHS